MKKGNRIPRKAKKIYFTWLIDTSGNKAGDKATAEKDDCGQWIETTESGKKYSLFVSLLRNADAVQIDRIETEEAPEPIKAEETTTTPEASQEEPKREPETATPYIKTLLAAFRAMYEELYKAQEDDETTETAYRLQSIYAAMFDEYSRSNPATLADFLRARGDYISSDREAAAYMLALETVEEVTREAGKACEENQTNEETPARPAADHTAEATTESHKTSPKRPATVKGNETHDRSRKRRNRAIMKATCRRPTESRRAQPAENYFFQDRSGSG